MLIVSLLLTGFYVTLIIAYYITWLRIPYYKTQPTRQLEFYSILIPSRNEALTITECLQDIVNQNYPASHFEIIVINDDSTDHTETVVTDFITQHPSYSISLLNTKNINQSGKKAAITYAVSQAKGKYLLLTDADCKRGNVWLSTIHNFMVTRPSKMVYAPVVFNAKTLFEKIQSLEFAGLVAIGGAAIELNNPNMCSGSNLVVEKDAFIAVEGYKGSEEIATGDDEYLLHKICKRFPYEVHFLKNNAATVYTRANNTLAELASQRKRWVSASTKYENIYITAILIAAYLFNALILVQLVVNPIVGLSMLMLKAIVEGLFLYSVLSFFNRKSYILLLPLAEPFHILYVLFIGIWGNMGTYNWKDRRVK